MLIRGARQVGKTWFMKEFGETAYEKFSPSISVRTAMTDYKREDWLLNIPLSADENMYTEEEASCLMYNISFGNKQNKNHFKFRMNVSSV